jgi:adenylate cyclase
VRITVQLIEAETGDHIWAERFDRAAFNVFAVQDEITARVVAVLPEVISDAEQQRAMYEQSECLGAWGAYQRGLWHMARPTVANFAHAQEFFRRAAKADPLFAPPVYRLAHLGILECAVYQRRSVHETISMAEPLIRRAMELDADDADALAVASSVAAWQGDWKRALARAEQSVDSNPNSVSARRALGFCLLNFQQPADAQHEFLACLQLNRRDPLNWLIRLQLGVAYYSGRQYELAAETLAQASAATPGDPEAHYCLAATLGQLDRRVEARAALEHAAKLAPERFPTIAPRRHTEDLEHLLDGLRRVGWRG